ncbi:hypothetical protein AALJ34_17190 [Paraclostridium bifermentans]|uniref:hypothetical protein n=1 Tax=Paraclostridium bifermentans TaxID=1490 RepID=UPI001C1035DB|nr:hypothetical protein [Paraclostridium bifermentans]MBU5290102.1 hypothetical protein [Paraclostridium bifermentans]
MGIIEELNNEQKLKVKDIKDPNITKIIELSKEFDLDPIVLVKYFISKESK